nr:ATP-binding protein [Streptomyces sp. QHH-9511]
MDEYTRQADETKTGYLDFLDLVLSEELAVPGDQRFRQGLRLSKLPHHKTLDEYDFSFQPELDLRKVEDLAPLSFVGAKPNAALLGPPGVGNIDLADQVKGDQGYVQVRGCSRRRRTGRRSTDGRGRRAGGGRRSDGRRPGAAARCGRSRAGGRGRHIGRGRGICGRRNVLVMPPMIASVVSRRRSLNQPLAPGR